LGSGVSKRGKKQLFFVEKAPAKGQGAKLALKSKGKSGKGAKQLKVHHKVKNVEKKWQSRSARPSSTRLSLCSAASCPARLWAAVI
jgi:microcystin degradation protein MlrC